MREVLHAKYPAEEMGPSSPAEIKLSQNQRVGFKTAVSHFIHESCEGLRFSYDIEKEEERTGILQGKSARAGQIPYNMQMDIDRLCLARSIECFMESGEREDAFDVYFCFLEMFWGGYSSSRRMIELLSEYESTASTILMSHRDHYSHSVYVFLLGLAMFDSIPTIQSEYKKYYKINDNQEAAHHFLQFWGMTSLFHDIGYPFEISFEQVKSYFSQRSLEGNKPISKGEVPFVCYGNMDAYLQLDEKSRKKLKEWYNVEFNSVDEWLAFDITEICKRSNCEQIKGKSPQDIMSVLHKEARPSISKEFMDHAYFSAIILFKELFVKVGGSSVPLKREHMDAITAIALHNSLYKRKITGDFALVSDKHPFMIEWHPLAYILQLADELQCWDRAAYGRNSRNELHPMACNMEFDSLGIYAEYIYDMAESRKIIDYWTRYEQYRENPELFPKPKLKKYSDMTHEKNFAKEIGLIVGLQNYGSCKGEIRLEVTQRVEKANWQNKRLYLSSSNFIHLYEFAAALNAQYNDSYTEDREIMDDFDTLSLEYKLSNIGQAKNYARALDTIGCFYTDRPVAYEMVVDFTDSELAILGKLEHERWEKEKKKMCWLPGDTIKDILIMDLNQLRELSRMHYDLGLAYSELSEDEKSKDVSPLNVMMKKLQEFDGVRIYRYKQYE